MVGSLFSKRPLETISSGNWLCLMRDAFFRGRPSPAGREERSSSACFGVKFGAGGTKREAGRAASAGVATSHSPPRGGAVILLLRAGDSGRCGRAFPAVLA